MSYCPFKEFKDLLGIPGEGVHSLRLLNTAAMDYIFTNKDFIRSRQPSMY